jgi:polysaccharide deacetylase family protein (PEP-CTERM system associated)
MLNALTIDVEEYFHAHAYECVIDRATWDRLPSRVAANTRRVLGILREHDTRATFFVLGWVAERHPGLVLEIARRGHEIACHGYGHELVYSIGAERFRADLKRARAAIEDAAGTAVEGYRAPSYSITERSLWGLEILAEEGFRFDSSIFPIHHPRYGIPGFHRQPVRLELDGGGWIDEFPLTTLPIGPLAFPLAGGAYLRFLPGSLFRCGLSRLIAAGEATVLYLHPWEIDPDQPRQPVGLRVRVNHYYNLRRTESRLRRLLERFGFAPMGEVLGALEQKGRLPRRAIPRRTDGGDPGALRRASAHFAGAALPSSTTGMPAASS